PASKYDWIAGLERVRRRLRYHSRKIDARYHWVAVHDLSTVGDSERVLVVQARIRNGNENVSLWQGTEREFLDGGPDGAVCVLKDQGSEWVGKCHVPSTLARRSGPARFFPFVSASR